MEPDKLAESPIATSSGSFISPTRVVMLLKDAAKKLASIFLMLIFTVAAFVVLAVSVVLMAAESMVSAILSKAKTPKKGSLQNLLQEEHLSPSELSQTK